MGSHRPGNPVILIFQERISRDRFFVWASAEARVMNISAGISTSFG
jgi:hypothetical protein